ncbi:MAG: hypothetical protein K6F61_05965 [Clostridiales bacterium]|nr:hypothetical protein [Clostridiales bacterium]
MIASLIYTFLYLYAGVMTVRFLLPRHRPLSRLWLGMSLGLLEEMWLPAIGAMWFTFGAEAHVFGAVVLLFLTTACWFMRDRRAPAGWDEKEDALLRQLLIIGIPLTILAAWLQYTHVMRVDEAGNWRVGQSTYGDLPMHLSFITGLIGKKFPADYPFYPGARLSYPFLTDSLSSTFCLLGCSLQAAVIIPAVLMMALCYTGVIILARDMTGGKRTALLAAALFFLNGGLGFLYDFDQAGGTWTTIDPNAPVFVRIGQTVSGWFATVGERIGHILTGYYKTPTNQPDPNNLRWSNVICDMMVPQRTLLGGWCMVIPCFYLLNMEFRPRMQDPANKGRGLILLGVWAGALPLIHTHSFLALGLASLGAMGYDLIHGDPKALPERRPRTAILARYMIYGTIAIILAAPQLFCFTFAQTFQDGSRSFLTLQFNWVNNPSGTGMRDLYLWFYIKNIGLPFLALIAALFDKSPRNRRIFAMALPIILAAEFVRFQPNEYDNNKLFYLAWLLCCMIISDWCSRLWKRLDGMRGRHFLAVLAALVTFLSAGLTIWRECVSDYVAFSRDAVEAAEFTKDNTAQDALFITGTQHLNPIDSIAGRDIVCGPDLYLYWHGFDTRERQAEIAAFYEDPEGHPEIPEKYGAEYVYVSSYERGSYDVDEEGLERIGLKVFENHEASIYRLAGADTKK